MAQELKLGFEFEFDDRVTENRKTRQWQVWLVLFRRPLKLRFSVNMNLGKLTKKKKNDQLSELPGHSEASSLLLELRQFLISI